MATTGTRGHGGATSGPAPPSVALHSAQNRCPWSPSPPPDAPPPTGFPHSPSFFASVTLAAMAAPPRPPPPRFQAGRSGRRRRAALRQPRPSFLPRPNCHISNPAASIIPAILSYLPRFYFCVMVASPVAASAWSPPPESFGLYPFSPLPFVARAPHDGRRSPLRSPAAASLFARDLPSV